MMEAWEVELALCGAWRSEDDGGGGDARSREALAAVRELVATGFAPPPDALWLEQLTAAAGGAGAGARPGFSLVLGAAALLGAFVRANFCGPPLLDAEVARLQERLVAPVLELAGAQQQQLPALNVDGEWHFAALRHPVWLRVAWWLLQRAEARRWPSSAWWRARCALVQQRVLLSGLSDSLQLLLDVELDAAWRALAPCAASRVRALFLVERGQAAAVFGRTRDALESFDSAAQLTGFSLALGGALGTRTKFQRRAIPQLVVLVAPGGDTPPPSGSGSGGSGDSTAPADPDPDPVQPLDVSREAAGDELLLNEPALLRDGAAEPLGATAQVLLLSHCRLTAMRSARHALTKEEMLAYLARLLECGDAEWAPRFAALLARCALEADEPRGALRAEAQLRALVAAVDAGTVSARVRLRHLFQSWPTSLLSVKRRWAETLLAMGDVSNALPVFQELQDWEKAAFCFCGADRADEAERLVRARLAADATPAEERPRLLCMLGELTDDLELLEESWALGASVLGSPFARAKRAAGQRQLACGLHAAAAASFEAALRVNPTYARTWFSLGFCHMQLSAWQPAATAFARCVGRDADWAEAHNNLAAMSLRLGRKREAFVALKEAWRCSDHSNWRVCENLAKVAADPAVGEWGLALHALRELAQMRPERVNAELLGAALAESCDLAPMAAALETHVEDPAVLGLLARYCAGRGETDQMRVWLTRQFRAARAREARDPGALVACLESWAWFGLSGLVEEELRDAERDLRQKVASARVRVEQAGELAADSPVLLRLQALARAG